MRRATTGRHRLKSLVARQEVELNEFRSAQGVWQEKEAALLRVPDRKASRIWPAPPDETVEHHSSQQPVMQPPAEAFIFHME